MGRTSRKLIDPLRLEGVPLIEFSEYYPAKDELNRLVSVMQYRIGLMIDNPKPHHLSVLTSWGFSCIEILELGVKI
jgi:hypothetical protein